MKILNKYLKMDPEESVPKSVILSKDQRKLLSIWLKLFYINKTVLNVLSYIYQYLKQIYLDYKVVIRIYEFENYTEIILSISINPGVKQRAC